MASRRQVSCGTLYAWHVCTLRFFQGLSTGKDRESAPNTSTVYVSSCRSSDRFLLSRLASVPGVAAQDGNAEIHRLVLVGKLKMFAAASLMEGRIPRTIFVGILTFALTTNFSSTRRRRHPVAQQGVQYVRCVSIPVKIQYHVAVPQLAPVLLQDYSMGEDSPEAKFAERDGNNDRSDTITHWACATREILYRIANGLDLKTGI